jgi:hypothetical protein
MVTNGSINPEVRVSVDKLYSIPKPEHFQPLHSPCGLHMLNLLQSNGVGRFLGR